MTVTVRKIRATPHRSAAQTWELITTLLASPYGAQARDELAKVSGIGAFLIESESLKSAPLVVWGSGPRIRIYCRYGDDAITGDGANENSFAQLPTDGEWNMSLPANEEDLNWIRSTLKSNGVQHVVVRDLSQQVEEEDVKETVQASQPLQVNEEVFRHL